MTILTAADVKRRSDAELRSLAWKLNLVAAWERPFSREWCAAQHAVDLVLAERCRRLARPRAFALTC